MVLDLSNVLIFRCYRKPDGENQIFSADSSPPKWALNKKNNNSIKINEIAPDTGNYSTNTNRQKPWIKIIKKQNELPTVELISRVRYKLWDADIETDDYTFDRAKVPFFKYWSKTNTYNNLPYQAGSIQGFPLFDVERTPTNWPVWHGGPHPLYTGLVKRLEAVAIHSDGSTFWGGPAETYLTGNGGEYEPGDEPEDFLLKQIEYNADGKVIKQPSTTTNKHAVVKSLTRFKPPNVVDLSGQKNIIVIDFRGLNMRWTDGCGNDFCGNSVEDNGNVKLKYLILRIKSSKEKVEDEKHRPFEPNYEHWEYGHHGKHDWDNPGFPPNQCIGEQDGVTYPKINSFKWGSGYGHGAYCKWYQTSNEIPPNQYIHTLIEQPLNKYRGDDPVPSASLDIRGPYAGDGNANAKGFLNDDTYNDETGYLNANEFWVTYTFKCDIIGPYDCLDFSTKLLYTNSTNNKWGKNDHFTNNINCRSDIFPQWVSIHDSDGNDGQEQTGDLPKYELCDNDNYNNLYVHINIWPKIYSSFEKDVGAGYLPDQNYGRFWDTNRWKMGRLRDGDSASNNPTHGSTQLIGGLYLASENDWGDFKSASDVGRRQIFANQYHGKLSLSPYPKDAWPHDGDAVDESPPFFYTNRKLLNTDIKYEGDAIFDISFGILKNGYSDGSMTDNSFNYTPSTPSTYRINNLLWCSLRSPRHLDISCGDYNSRHQLKLGSPPQLAWPNSSRYIPNFVKLTNYGWKNYNNNPINCGTANENAGIANSIFGEVMRHRAKCRGGGYAKNPEKKGWEEDSSPPVDGYNTIDLPRRSKNPYFSNINSLTGIWNEDADRDDVNIDQYAALDATKDTVEDNEPTVDADSHYSHLNIIGNPGIDNDEQTKHNGKSNYFDIYYKLLVPPAENEKFTIKFTFETNHKVTFYRHSNMDGTPNPTGKKPNFAKREEESITLTWDGKPNDVSGDDATQAMQSIRIFDIASGTSEHPADIECGEPDNVFFEDLTKDKNDYYKFTANIWQLYLENPENIGGSNTLDDLPPESSRVLYNQNEIYSLDVKFIPSNKPIYSYNNAQNGWRGMAGGDWAWCKIKPYHNIKDLSWNIKINASTLKFTEDQKDDTNFSHEEAQVDVSNTMISNWADETGNAKSIEGGKGALKLIPRATKDSDRYIINIPLLDENLNSGLLDGDRQKIFNAVQGSVGPRIWTDSDIENSWEINDPFKNYTNHPFSDNFLEAMKDKQANWIKIPHPDLFDQEYIILDYWKWYNLLSRAEVEQGNNPGNDQNIYWTTYEHHIQTLALVDIISLTTPMKYILINDSGSNVIKNNNNVIVNSAITVTGYPDDAADNGNIIIIKVNKIDSAEEPLYLTGLNKEGENNISLTNAITVNNYINDGITKITLKSIEQLDDHDDWYDLFDNISVFGLNNGTPGKSWTEIIVNRVNIAKPGPVFADEKYYFLSDDNKTVTLKWDNGGQGYDFNTNDGDIYWTITKVNRQTHETKPLLSAQQLSRNNGQYEFIDNDLRIYDKYQYKISGEYRWGEIDTDNNNKDIDLFISISVTTETIFICKNNQFPYGRYNTTSTNLKLYRPLLLNSEKGQCDKVDENGNATGKCVGGLCTAEYTASRSRGGTRNIYANTTNPLTKKQTFVLLSKSGFRPFR